MFLAPRRVFFPVCSSWATFCCHSCSSQCCSADGSRCRLRESGGSRCCGFSCLKYDQNLVFDVLAGDRLNESLTLVLEHPRQNVLTFEEVWVVDHFPDLVFLHDAGARHRKVLGELGHHLSADTGCQSLHARIVEVPVLRISADSTEQALLFAWEGVEILFPVPALIVRAAHELAKHTSETSFVEVLSPHQGSRHARARRDFD